MTESFPFSIAEVANTHGGDPGYLREIVSQLCRTKIDAVKFQIIFADELLTRNHPQYPVFQALQMAVSVWEECFQQLRDAGKRIAVDVFGGRSLDLAARLKANFVKIHATDFTNQGLISQAMAKRIPLLLGAGGATEKEIEQVAQWTRSHPVCFLIGFQKYPTPIEESHLNRIPALRERFQCPVGYADHVAGDSPVSFILPSCAVALGADVIEKHVKLSDRLAKYDSEAAISVEEVNPLLDRLHLSRLARGRSSFTLSEKEKDYRESVRKQLVYRSKAPRGEYLHKENVAFLRAPLPTGETPVQPSRLDHFITRPVRRDISENTVISEEIFE